MSVTGTKHDSLVSLESPPATKQTTPLISDEATAREIKALESGITPLRVVQAASVNLNQGGMLARRYELKYRIPETLAYSVRSYLLHYMQPDIYTARQPSGQYGICSIYLDSSEMNLFRETFQDKCNRFKLRIRGYDDNPSTPVFFEIKRKLNRIVYKSRVAVAKHQIQSVLKGDMSGAKSEKDLSVLRQFYHYSSSLRAHPIALVRYQREAFECEGESRVRITFDRKISCRSIGNPTFTMNGAGWTELPISFVVLEIKFSEHFPAWVHHMVQYFNLNRQSMSKYCTTVRHLTSLGLFHPLSLH